MPRLSGMESTTLRYGLGKVHPGGSGGTTKKAILGAFLTKKKRPKECKFHSILSEIDGRPSDVLHTRDQELSKYAYIVGNGVDYPEIWPGQGPPRGVRGTAKKAILGSF